MNRVADSSKQNATASDSADTIFDEPPNAAPTAVGVDKPRNKNLRIDSEKETGDTEAQPAAPKTLGFYGMRTLPIETSEFFIRSLLKNSPYSLLESYLRLSLRN